jgi:hypothetical protein
MDPMPFTHTENISDLLKIRVRARSRSFFSLSEAFGNAFSQFGKRQADSQTRKGWVKIKKKNT